MSQPTTPASSQHYSARASLAAIGAYLRQLDLFAPIREQLKITHS
jgi:hypothetical protein